MSVTIKDVAREAGVTPAVVSRTLNNDKTLSIKDETRERVLVAAKKLRYRPNPFAQNLRSNNTKSIGMLVPDIANPFFTDIIKGAQDAALERDMYIVLLNTDEVWQKEKKLINMLVGKKVDGILYLSAHLDIKATELMGKAEMPYVLVNRNAVNTGKSFVGLDNIKGAMMAMEHLYEQGHQKIAHLAGPLYTDTASGRAQGYRAGLMVHGLELRQEYIIETEYSYEGGRDAMVQLLKDVENRPTAVFAANDLIAMGAVAGAAEMGLSVPSDISIIGFNDIWIAKHFMPPLSTVGFDNYRMGKEACKMLIETIDNPHMEARELILEPYLCVRDSVAKI